MDFSLAAPKMLVRDLSRARAVGSAFRIGKQRFQRAWIQGVLVTGNGQTMSLDDGSGTIELHFPKESDKRLLQPGMYVLVIGAYHENSPITVHKITDLSGSPNSEALWNLEVIEAYQLFYRNENESW